MDCRTRSRTRQVAAVHIRKASIDRRRELGGRVLVAPAGDCAGRERTARRGRKGERRSEQESEDCDHF